MSFRNHGQIPAHRGEWAERNEFFSRRPFPRGEAVGDHPHPHAQGSLFDHSPRHEYSHHEHPHHDHFRPDGDVDHRPADWPGPPEGRHPEGAFPGRRPIPPHADRPHPERGPERGDRPREERNGGRHDMNFKKDPASRPDQKDGNKERDREARSAQERTPETRGNDQEKHRDEKSDKAGKRRNEDEAALVIPKPEQLTSSSSPLPDQK